MSYPAWAILGTGASQMPKALPCCEGFMQGKAQALTDTPQALVNPSKATLPGWGMCIPVRTGLEARFDLGTNMQALLAFKEPHSSSTVCIKVQKLHMMIIHEVAVYWTPAMHSVR